MSDIDIMHKRLRMRAVIALIVGLCTATSYCCFVWWMRSEPVVTDTSLPLAFRDQPSWTVTLALACAGTALAWIVAAVRPAKAKDETADGGKGQ